MSTVITLPQQPVFTVPRDFANQHIAFTDINGQLYLTMDQMCQLSGLARQTVQSHMTALQGMPANSGMPTTPAYQNVYEIPVYYPAVDGQRSGGTKPTNFYHVQH